jgi:hypothetical protein
MSNCFPLFFVSFRSRPALNSHLDHHPGNGGAGGATGSITGSTNTTSSSLTGGGGSSGGGGAGSVNKTLGVLYTGYLEKKNPVTGSFKKRFIVLTQSAIHWFVREEGNDLFGDERGQITLSNILTSRILDEDSTLFELQTVDHKKKYFRCSNSSSCEEWVSAIRSAIKTLNATQNRRSRDPNATLQRRQTISGIRNQFVFEDEDEENKENQEVTVTLVSLFSRRSSIEIVITRNPEWNRIITLPLLQKGN